MRRIWPVLTLLFAAAAVLLWWLPRRGVVSRRETESSAPVVMAVKKVARLATVEVQVADVVQYQQVKSFFFLDFPKSALLRVRGSVLGGFDLDAGGFRVDAEHASRLVRVHFPGPRILAIDPRIEWLDEKSGIFNPVTPEDRTRWILWARGELGRAAREAGLYEKAEEQARTLVAGVAAAFGWKSDVEFGLAETPAEPRNLPAPPAS